MSNEPVAWIEAPNGKIKMNPFYKMTAPQSLSWSIPLYPHPAPDDTALLRQALEALQIAVPGPMYYRAEEIKQWQTAITALRERLALSDAALLAPKPGQLKDRGKK